MAWDLELEGKKWADGKNVSPFSVFLSRWVLIISDETVQVNLGPYYYESCLTESDLSDIETLDP